MNLSSEHGASNAKSRMRLSRRRPAVLVVVAAGVACAFGTPAGAQAATVRSSQEIVDVGEVAVVLRYEGGDAANHLTMSPAEDLRVRVEDSGDPLTAGGEGCRQVDAHTALCRYDVVQVRGGAGDDALDVSGVERLAFVDGEAGDDVLTAGSGGSYFTGGSGSDVLRGGRGVDYLTPGADGADTPAGNVDVVTGGPGNDVLDSDDRSGSANSDTFFGGRGRDRLDYENRSTGVRVDLSGSEPAGEPGENDRVASIESVNGGGGDDELIGNEADNAFIGSSGADRLIGNGGNDSFSEAEFGPRSGADTYDGGPGRDSLDLLGRAEPIRLDLSGPAPHLATGGDAVTAVEHVLGSFGDDVLIGDDGPNRLDGGTGDDVLRGGGGRDIVNGATGADRIYGDGGRNILIGADGNDFLDALNGVVDILRCDRGSDRIRADRADTALGCERRVKP